MNNPQPTTPTGFTPGPWEVISSCVFSKADKERYEGHRVAVATCGDEMEPKGGLKYGAERDANALLISQAPAMALELEELRAQKAELLEALKEAEAHYIGSGRTSKTVAGESGLVADRVHALLGRIS